MRRDKDLAEEILRTLVLDEQPTLHMTTIAEKLKERAPEATVRYHTLLLEDIGLVTISEKAYVRVTSAGQDRAENRDTVNPMATWVSLGT